MAQATDRSTAVLATKVDAELVAEAAAGLPGAFDELYRRHSQTAWRVAQAVTRNSHDAADAVSEAFVKVIKAVAAGRLEDGGSFRSYLLTSTRHCAIDTLRRTTRTEPTDDDTVLDLRGTVTTPADRLEGGESAAFVTAAFNELPERWRSVLWLTEVEGIPPREAATHLGLSANGTAQLAVRARAGLRERYLQAHLRSEVPEACQFTVDRLGAYVGGALSTRDLAKVDQHLAGCEECRTRKEELEDLGRSLRLILLPVPLALSGMAVSKWQSSIAATSTATSSNVSWLVGSEWAQKALAGAAAAVFAAGALGAFFVERDNDPPDRELAAPAGSSGMLIDRGMADVPEVASAPDPVIPKAVTVRVPAKPAAQEPEPEPDPEPEPEPVVVTPEPQPPALPPPSDEEAAPPPEPPDPDGDGGDDDVTQVAVGGRMGDNTLEVQAQLDAEGCTGVTAGSTTVGCEPEAAPEEDGLSVNVGGGGLPEAGVTLP